ncbi:hypothetical protein FB451DRAFT_1383058 [Mycena latifolia]|nr:hypothetical protein FB451DRAFT_1383058 [Mycena latifolia]
MHRDLRPDNLARLPMPMRPRAWAWASWIHTYRDHLPGPPLDEAAFCIDFLLFAGNFHTDEGAAAYICATPGFNFLIARAWTFVLDDEAEDWRELALTQLWCFVADMEPTNPTNFEDIVAGVGGTLGHLSDIVVRCMDHTLDTQESPVSGRTVYFLRIILDFLVPAEYMGTTGDVGARELGPFSMALLDHGIVPILTRTACAISKSAEDDSAYALNRCYLLLGRIIVSDIGHERLLSALANGLLRALVSSANFTDEIHRRLELFFAVLPPALVYYPVISEIEAALHESNDLASTKAFRGSKIYEKWQAFSKLAHERLAVLHMFDSPDYVPLKACDSLECGSINLKTNVKRCSGCLCFYYCSATCQSANWRVGGHRRACATYKSLSLSEHRPLTVRERDFLRVLVHEAYGAAKATIYAQQAAGLRHAPDATFVTMFDYTGAGPVRITVLPADVAVSKLMILGDITDEWEDSVARAARSGGRMSLHVVTIRAGRGSRSLVVPLRKSRSDVDRLLKEMAEFEDVMRPEFSARFQAQFENVDRDVVETH